MSVDLKRIAATIAAEIGAKREQAAAAIGLLDDGSCTGTVSSISRSWPTGSSGMRMRR